MFCACPESASLPTITIPQCAQSFGQTQKVIFQRLKKANGDLNGFTSTAAPTLLASWTPLLTASDGTKVVVSPYIEAPTLEPGAARTFGGGNETLGGVETVIGREPSSFTAVIRSMPQSVIKELKKMQCEKIGVYLVNEQGAIMANKEGTEQAPIWRPIPIRSLFFGDLMLGGLEAPDQNSISWVFPPNYSDNLTVVVPTDFNALELD